jgi:hypothetical protein
MSCYEVGTAFYMHRTFVHYVQDLTTLYQLHRGEIS